ncbi:hypothetical protein rosmuc_00256 [Roseovarius mucosus DSM 17069]|uniref:Uncharacterized protein n=1 Tax=Roseovarius mucosus DSM 17069 TaxID=1288298 RepID=A0A0A0HP65_9RHOB|nr:hypothetical protein [Roseovarius mucosus]KGM89662.1 hypothetical protein rosmuc_00256 [Roseovarius mucosus DSM 17069]
MNELDARLAKIRRQKAEALTTAADDFAKLREGLAEAQNKLADLDAARQTLSEAVESDSHRIAGLRRRVTIGVVLVALVAALVMALTGAVASRLVGAAQTEATRIRTENAQKIAEARAEGEAALQALSDRLASREAALSAEIEAMGADLAQLGADRDTARADLERFAELRRQIGFDLVPYRDRVVIVVPQGEAITRWSAPGLSDIARYNGRMFRVVRN